MSKENKKIDTQRFIHEALSAGFVSYIVLFFIAPDWYIKLKAVLRLLIGFLSGTAIYLMIMGLYLFLNKRGKQARAGEEK